jgi:hypothetical protein
VKVLICALEPTSSDEIPAVWFWKFESVTAAEGCHVRTERVQVVGTHTIEVYR